MKKITYTDVFLANHDVALYRKFLVQEFGAFYTHGGEDLAARRSMRHLNAYGHLTKLPALKVVEQIRHDYKQLVEEGVV